jgi:hypothetical protein
MAIPPIAPWGMTGIGGQLPRCYGCGDPNISVKWEKITKWPEWKNRTPGTNICDKCYKETKKIFRKLKRIKPENLPLFISHPNGFVRARAINLLEKV